MNFGQFLLSSPVGVEIDIEKQRQELENLRVELRQIRKGADRGEIARLRTENDELRLYLAALVRILTSKGIVTGEELRNIIDVIDEEDGERDGRFSGDIV